MDLLSLYWKPLAALGLILSIIGYIGYQRHEINALQRDNASLQQTIELAKAIGKAQNEKAARMQQGAQQAVILQAQQGQSELTKIKAYYESHPVFKRIPVSVRQPAANPDSGQLSSVPTPSEEPADSRADTDTAATGQSLEESCAITTSQYNTLYQSWMNACAEAGCK